MSDYTVEMFHQDHNEMLPKSLTPQNAVKEIIKDAETAGNASSQDLTSVNIVELFIDKYGKSKGIDYGVRFLSIMQFIEHYQKDLERDGLINNTDGSMQVQNELLHTLLTPFKRPQPPNKVPSSPLFNQEHEFNYKKVKKALRP